MSTTYRRELAELSAPVTVSGDTVLMPWTFLSNALESMLFAGINLSETDSVTLVLDTSEDASHPDEDKCQTITAGPGKQASFEVGGEPLRSYWRLSAQSVTNPVQVRWRVVLGRR